MTAPVVTEGTLTISRSSNDDAHEGRTIELMVKVGRRRVARVRVTPELLAMALTGLAEVPARVELAAP